MLTVLQWVLLAAALFVCMLAGFLLFQVMSAVVALRKQRGNCAQPEQSTRAPCVVIIPAHNESLVISATLESVKRQLCAGDQLLVVADNCSDDTAHIARLAGAHVLERTDANERGKGYALAAGVDWAAHQGWMSATTIVVFVDADCLLHKGALHSLVLNSQLQNLPQQALYLMRNPQNSIVAKSRVSELAWRLKNQVRPMGLAYWGLGCPAMGTGMALPWSIVKKLQLASGDIVEDMRMGIDLQLLGYPMQFCPVAQVTSEFPSDEEALVQQRQRWEHGHLAVVMSTAPKLLAQAMAQRSWSLLWFALDLTVPPLTFFSVLVGSLACITLLVSGFWGVWLPSMFALAALTALVVAVMATWWFWGRDLLTTRELLSLPLLLISKFPVYWRFFTQRQKTWVKTERE